MNKQIFYGELLPYFQDALHIREVVFTNEQGYAKEIDHDEIDSGSFHVVCYDINGTPIATARLFENEEEQQYLIGRVAVIKNMRSTGIGYSIMKELLRKATELGVYHTVTVHAQVAAENFYRKLGFETVGDVFLEEGEPHITMTIQLKRRGFEVAKGFESYDIVLPERKTHASAGYDLETIEDVTLPAHSTVLVPTGLKAYMEEDEVLTLHIRSSIAVKQNVWCANNVGIIDADYYSNPSNDGHIMVPLYNANEESVTFQKGDRVAQAIFSKYLTVDNEDENLFSERAGGFGSTGSK